MSALLSSITGGGGIPKLAPDLDLPSRLTESSNGQETVNVDPSGVLTTVLSLSGKFAIYYMQFQGLPTTENVVIKVTVDGTVIHNDTYTPAVATLRLYANASAVGLPGFACGSTLLVEVQTITDTSVDFFWVARAIA